MANRAKIKEMRVRAIKEIICSKLEDAEKVALVEGVLDDFEIALNSTKDLKMVQFVVNTARLRMYEKGVKNTEELRIEVEALTEEDIAPDMGRPVQNTDEEILEVAKKLASEGVYPSVRKVRETLGGGSMNRIAEILNSNREHLTRTQIERVK